MTLKERQASLDAAYKQARIDNPQHPLSGDVRLRWREWNTEKQTERRTR